jgi:hypothetical protein
LYTGTITETAGEFVGWVIGFSKMPATAVESAVLSGDLIVEDE